MHTLQAAPSLQRSLIGGHTPDLSYDPGIWPAAARAGASAWLPANLTPRQCLQTLRGLRDWTEVARFSPLSYLRTRIYGDDQREVYVMGWQPGQFSAIHDHGESACAYEVLRGCLLEEVFVLTGPQESPELIEAHSWPAGSLLCRTGDAVHRCGNALSSGAPLITMHVYDSPARSARTYPAR